ncbi:division/cell wall cluster transcriptional repressor MraZ [candidate division WOR-3 bacterium JGI_Cruoil_03_44_89]|mgnify:FL=1|uniref:Transcriptional regulator MraZ n=1 Tax=candidate division WOR-3 bacterium JGI_Cruoil_03_44_89 TaxID=1973748 RepID=A0A235BT19_UNCW3|nr:MAG: division/cell wall cluster transcriptional repressor MraZ [candidate division WOR-3 bacterium JGI_Cruoil_03_44_89]
MFNGFERHNIEEKGRLAVPAKFRKDIEDSMVVITRGYDGCLTIYTLQEWRIFEERLSKLTMADPRARRTIRWFCGNAEVLKLDRQGRVNIPQHLLDFAGVKKEVVITGILNHLEVWSIENYERQNLSGDPSEIEGIEGMEVL